MNVTRISSTEFRPPKKTQSHLQFGALEIGLAKSSPLIKLYEELGISKVRIAMDFKKNLNHIVIVKYQFLNSKNEKIFEIKSENNFMKLSIKNMFDNIEDLILKHKEQIAK
jgi:hypothetical protein